VVRNLLRPRLLPGLVVLAFVLAWNQDVTAQVPSNRAFAITFGVGGSGATNNNLPAWVTRPSWGTFTGTTITFRGVAVPGDSGFDLWAQYVRSGSNVETVYIGYCFLDYGGLYVDGVKRMDYVRNTPSGSIGDLQVCNLPFPDATAFPSASGPVFYWFQLTPFVNTGATTRPTTAPSQPAPDEAPEVPEVTTPVYDIIAALTPYPTMTIAVAELIVIADEIYPSDDAGLPLAGFSNETWSSHFANAFDDLEADYPQVLTASRSLLGLFALLSIGVYSTRWIAWGLGMRNPEKAGTAVSLGS